MEKWTDGKNIGKNFLVVYNDDTGRARTKRLVYEGESPSRLLWFHNSEKGKSESINADKIIRMEEI